MLDVVNKREGIKKFDSLIDVARIYAASNHQKALIYAQEARQISFQFGDTLRIISASRILGQLFNRLTRPKEAEQVLTQALAIAERHCDRKEYKLVLNNLAISFTMQANMTGLLNLTFEL
jgi:hypothetical protein